MFPIARGNTKRLFTERTSSVDVAVKPEDLYAGIREESHEKENHKRQDYHETCIAL